MIHRLAAAGIVQGGASGLPASSYGPHLGVRRDQMASSLLRAAAYAAGQDLRSHTGRFPDVPPSNPHFATVNGAADAGLARGHADGTYRPAAGVRRDQMATFVLGCSTTSPADGRRRRPMTTSSSATLCASSTQCATHVVTRTAGDA